MGRKKEFSNYRVFAEELEEVQEGKTVARGANNTLRTLRAVRTRTIHFFFVSGFAVQVNKHKYALP